MIFKRIWEAIFGPVPVSPELNENMKEEQPQGIDGFRLYFPRQEIIVPEGAYSSVYLRPGKKLMLKIFNFEHTVTSEECYAKLSKEKSILLGLDGAHLAYKCSKRLPKGKWCISFDEKDSLSKVGPIWEWKSNVYVLSPVPEFGPDLEFIFGPIQEGWNPEHYCLLCFCESK